MFTIKCKRHPRYQGKNRPTTCKTCYVLYKIANSHEKIKIGPDLSYEAMNGIKLELHDCGKAIMKRVEQALNKGEKESLKTQNECPVHGEEAQKDNYNLHAGMFHNLACTCFDQKK